MDTVFLSHLAHDSQVISSEFVPYAIACILSHLLAHSKHPFDARLFVYPGKFAKAFREVRPSVAAFSNYMWNLDLSYSFAEAVKKEYPDTLVIFGGPNLPLETRRQEAWLRARPAVDVYLAGEAEQPFLEVMELWRQCHSIEEVRRACINGSYALADGRLRKTVGVRQDGFDDTPRVQDLDATPSPYLMGYLDEFLQDPALVPIMEGNRGCPFACTFCVDGIAARTKVKKATVDRLQAEIEYIAERYHGQNLMIADTNFGMYPDDVEFCKVLARTRERYGYPQNVIASTGKNRQELILQCAEILGGALRIDAAVQSMDDEVLRNIKRSNISYQGLVSLSQRASGTESNTFTEVILALPGDSKARHWESVCRLVDTGLNQIRIHTLMILEGSELATGKERGKWKMHTRFRAIPRCFGAYEFGPERLKSVEIEEVCVENDTMSFEDFVECRRLALTVTLFYNDRVFAEIAALVKLLGWRVSDWLLFVHDNVPRHLAGLRSVYDDFVAQTVGELWESREALERRIKGEDGVIEQYIRGETGNNVLLTNQARVYQNYMDELNEAAFHCTREFLKSRGHDGAAVSDDYLRQLELYSLWKKKGLMDLDTEYELEMDYDFVALEQAGFTEIPARQVPTAVRFAYLPWQKDLLGDQLLRFGSSLPGWGKILSRIPIKKMHRRAAYAREAVTAVA